MKFVQCVFVMMLLLMASTLPAQAQTQFGQSVQETEERGEQDLEELIRLLSDPELVNKLQQRLSAATEIPSDDALSVSGLQAYFQASLNNVEKRAGNIVDALSGMPGVSGALSVAWAENMASTKFLKSAIYVIIFLFGGFGLEWLYWCYLTGTLKRINVSRLGSKDARPE